MGQYVSREAIARGFRVFSSYLSKADVVEGAEAVRVDLADPTSLRRAFSEARPDAVVLCAALTGVDCCEDHPQKARRVNAEGPALVADLCAHSNAHLVHVSTDYVFDGEAGPYDERAEPHPLSVYGQTKRWGEVAVLTQLPGSSVVRLCAVYGWNRLRDKENSVTWILNRLRRGDPVPLFTDQRVSPTYAGDAGPVLLRLVESEATGIYHLAPLDCVTRLQLGEIVCAVYDLPPSLLRASSLAEARLKARRPYHSCLVSHRLEKLPNTQVRSLRFALEHMRDAE